MQTSAFGGRPQDARQIVDAARRERKAFRSWCEARRVGDGGHFDRALRAVEKRVEDLRVEIAGGNILGAEAVVKPYGRRRRRVICGQIFRALAGCNDLEAGRATPIDHFTNQRRLIAIRQRVHNAGVACAFREKRPRERIGFHIHHHDVLMVLTTRERVTDAHIGFACCFDDDVDLRCTDQRQRIVGDERRSVALGSAK